MAKNSVSHVYVILSFVGGIQGPQAPGYAKNSTRGKLCLYFRSILCWKPHQIQTITENVSYFSDTICNNFKNIPNNDNEALNNICL